MQTCYAECQGNSGCLSFGFGKQLRPTKIDGRVLINGDTLKKLDGVKTSVRGGLHGMRDLSRRSHVHLESNADKAEEEIFKDIEKMMDLGMGTLWGAFLISGGAPADFYKCLTYSESSVINVFDLIMGLVKDIDDGDLSDVASAFENGAVEVLDSLIDMIGPCRSLFSEDDLN